MQEHSGSTVTVIASQGLKFCQLCIDCFAFLISKFMHWQKDISQNILKCLKELLKE